MTKRTVSPRPDDCDAASLPPSCYLIAFYIDVSWAALPSELAASYTKLLMEHLDCG